MEMQIIKLLNEFENEKSNTHIVYWHYYQNWFHYLENDKTYSELLMISKEHWFIKWLLDTKKIDRDKLYVEMNWVVYFNYYEQEVLEEYSDSDWLIMLLSIQDDPIEFLISKLEEND